MKHVIYDLKRKLFLFVKIWFGKVQIIETVVTDHLIEDILNATSVGASRSKATRTAVGTLEALALFEHWVLNFLAYKLCNTVPLGNRELFSSMVKEDHTHIAGIILVHDASSDINVVLGSEARPRRYPSIRPFGYANLDISLHDGLALCRYDAVVGGSQIVACCPSRTLCWSIGIVGKLRKFENRSLGRIQIALRDRDF